MLMQTMWARWNILPSWAFYCTGLHRSMVGWHLWEVDLHFPSCLNWGMKGFQGLQGVSLDNFSPIGLLWVICFWRRHDVSIITSYIVDDLDVDREERDRERENLHICEPTCYHTCHTSYHHFSVFTSQIQCVSWLWCCAWARWCFTSSTLERRSAIQRTWEVGNEGESVRWVLGQRKQFANQCVQYLVGHGISISPGIFVIFVWVHGFRLCLLARFLWNNLKSC